MNLRPLWTASVWPTNSGRIVDRRDHVFKTFFCRARFRSSIRRSSRSSMYGPFFSERPMGSALLFGPPRHDVAVRRPRTPAGLVPLGGPTPGRHRVIALALALATAHRMVDGIHHSAPHGGTESLPANPASLADRDVLVIQIADLSDRRHAVELDLADLAGGQLDVGVIALLGQELGQGAGAPAELAALAGLELDVVHERAERDIPDGQGIARQDIRLRPGHDHVAGLEPERRDDVALLAVPVVEQGDAGRSIRIVLDCLDDGGDPELLPAKIDVAQHALVPAPAVANGDATGGVAPIAPALRRQQALFRRRPSDLLVGEERHVATCRRRGLDASNCHSATLPVARSRRGSATWA